MKNHNSKRKWEGADKQSQGASSAANKKQKPFNERGNKYDKKNKKDKNAGKGSGKDDAKKPAAGTPQKQGREEAFDESIGKMDGQLLADHFLQKAKRHNKDLTAVELSDMSIPGMFIAGDIL